jgi:hypothetical protein
MSVTAVIFGISQELAKTAEAAAGIPGPAWPAN